MAQVSFSHVGVVARDPLALERFYTTHFGFERTRVYAPGPEQVVMIRNGSFYLEIFKAEEDSPAPPPTEAGPMYPSWRHVCFSVDDLDGTLAEMGDDANVTLGPLDMGEFVKGMRVAWLADPAGNIIELNQGYVDEQDPPPLES